jgi:hypothetical protein
MGGRGEIITSWSDVRFLVLVSSFVCCHIQRKHIENIVWYWRQRKEFLEKKVAKSFQGDFASECMKVVSHIVCLSPTLLQTEVQIHVLS